MTDRAVTLRGEQSILLKFWSPPFWAPVPVHQDVDDPPRFGSLSRWPELRAYCQAAWLAFPQWFDAARAALFPLITAAHVASLR